MTLKWPEREIKNPRTYGSGLIGVQQNTTKLVPVIEATGQPADGKTPFEKPLPD
ncbi:hypothetical protein [Collimonas antrihumi]|uniref:hypothetical protein n=1 Tax=Collimonas antrihumi TaxID=1940615 RepID=UPI001B8B03C1|nr:hypothetical protein [Collimonas antrihumi]